MKRFIGGCVVIGLIGGCAQIPVTFRTPEPKPTREYALDRQITFMYNTASKRIMPKVSTYEYALEEPKSVEDIRRYFDAPKVPGWNGLPAKPSFEDSELSKPGLVIRQLIRELGAVREDYRNYHNQVMGFEAAYNRFLEKQNQRYGNKK